MNWGRYIRYIDYPALIRTRTRPNSHLTVEDTHVFSPELVNTARFGLYKETLKDGDPVSNVTPVKGDQVIKDLGIQGVNPQNLSAMGFPIMASHFLWLFRISPSRPEALPTMTVTGVSPIP